MVATSQDVLYLTVALCLTVFTVFLCWLIYYLVQISRQSNELITDFRARLEEFDASVQEMKVKITDSVDALAGVSKQVGLVVDMVRNFSASRKTSATRKQRT